MFGAIYFGESYFAGQQSSSLPTTRPECGGIFGTATFGQPYFAGHNQCGEEPVVTPVRRRAGGMMPAGANRLDTVARIESILLAFLTVQSEMAYRRNDLN